MTAAVAASPAWPRLGGGRVECCYSAAKRQRIFHARKKDPHRVSQAAVVVVDDRSLRCDRANHTLAKLLWSRFKFAEFEQFLDDVFHHASAFFDVSHFSAAEDDRYLHLVLVLQESNGLFDLKPDIVFTGLGAQSNFFSLAVMASTLAMFLFAFFVFVLPVVHDAAHGRFFIGCDFNQIQPDIASSCERLFGGDDAELFTILADHPNLRNAYLVVDPRLGLILLGSLCLLIFA